MKTTYRGGIAAAIATVVLLSGCSSSSTHSSSPQSGGSGPTSVASGALFTAAPATTTGAWQVPISQCPDQAAVTKKLTKTVSVGGTFPFTGPAAAFAPFYTAMSAYVKYANGRHLLKGVSVSLKGLDDAYDANKTVSATSQLINDGVDIFAGSIGSPTQLAVRGTLNNACIPQLLVAAGSNDFSDVAKYPWTNAISVPYADEAKAYGTQIAADHPNGATVATVIVNNDAGSAYVNALDSVASQDKLTVVSHQLLDPTDTSPPTSQITAIAHAKPDVVFGGSVGAGCVTLLNSLAQAQATDPSWKPQIYLVSTCANSAILRSAQSAANGVRTAQTYYDVSDPKNANVPGVKTYLAAMASAGQSKVASAGTLGWLAGEALFGILKLAQQSPTGLTRQSIMNAARNIKLTSTIYLPGITGISNGTSSPSLSGTVQVEQFDAKAAHFTPVGQLITPTK